MTWTSEQKEMGRFLLGELPDEDAERLEERLFSDDDSFAEMQAAEMELVDRYVRNQMSDAERRGFETNYLVTPEHRAKVAEARVFHNELEKLRPVVVPQ